MNKIIIKEETEGNTKKITYADFKRYKRFHYDETISFSDWEEIKGTKKGKDTKTELKTISGEIKVVDSSWNEKKRFIGICIKNDHHEVGHYYVEKCEILFDSFTNSNCEYIHEILEEYEKYKNSHVIDSDINESLILGMISGMIYQKNNQLV